MKKIYAMLFFTATTLSVSAQSVITSDFEEVTLTPESYDNGSAGNGDFNINGIFFSNYYDSDWMSWYGFSVSNITDNITAGWGNQYSAFTGSGRNSANYGVYYPDGTIYYPGNISIDSFYITNTSYAAISMRDGDSFGKQFGSIYDANGDVDGTNGEDYFRVWVICEDEMLSQKDSVEVYLADYRFANSSEDYILDEWLKVDLTSLGFPVATVSFRFESSDMGTWGINTPTYFAVDDVSFSYFEGLAEIETFNVEAYPNPVSDKLTVTAPKGEIRILSTNGSIVFESKHDGHIQVDMSGLESGIYILEAINEAGNKSIEKIIR